MIKVVNANDVRRQIPEVFLWIIFRAMVEALALMQTGKVKSPPSRVVLDPKQADVDIVPMKDWKPMVHQDIKLQNMVLAESDDYYPAFKLPKMIDFGLHSEKEPNLTLTFATPGTRGLMDLSHL